MPTSKQGQVFENQTIGPGANIPPGSVLINCVIKSYSKIGDASTMVNCTFIRTKKKDKRIDVGEAATLTGCKGEWVNVPESANMENTKLKNSNIKAINQDQKGKLYGAEPGIEVQKYDVCGIRIDPMHKQVQHQGGIKGYTNGQVEIQGGCAQGQQI